MEVSLVAANVMSVKTYDIAIIGGGFTGTALAYYCRKAGGSVILLEAGSLGSGTSAACAGRAQIIESESDAYLDLVLEGFSKLSGLGAELETDLEWEMPGHLTLLSNEGQWRQYEKLVQRLNDRKVEAHMLDCAALHELEPNLQAQNFIGAAYSTEGHLNPFKFCMGFANSARRRGATLLTHTAVSGFKQQASRITRIQSGKDEISAGIVILAAGAWSGNIAGLVGNQLPMKFTHAQAMVTEPLPRFIHHHIGISGFYEAVHGNQRTVTLGLGQHPNGSLVVSNAIQQSQEINTESTAWGMPAISQALSQFFPMLSRARIVRSWAMPSPFLPDYLPAIGWLPEVENMYVAAGFHLAIPTIPLLAEAIANSIIQSKSSSAVSLLDPFSPGRFVV